jgi:hypothetical protein
MNTFKSVFEHYNWDDINPNLRHYNKTSRASTNQKSLDDFLLISPAALSKWHKNAMN